MAEQRDSAVQTGSHGDVSLVRHGQLSQLHAVPVVCKRLTTTARLALARLAHTRGTHAHGIHTRGTHTPGTHMPGTHTCGTHARGTHTCALSTVTENQNRGVP